MKIIRSFSELVNERNQIRDTLGLVPTMGALHEGHLSLVKTMREHVDKVMVSIFVNPMQFGPNEDFSKYPRNESEDIEKLKMLADYVYIPEVKDIYPANETTAIHISGELNEVLEAKFRPTHFDGVATVVNILFNQTGATHAIFGEKDYQQLMVIKQMVHELSLPIKILSAEILRESDGLAMSSRNKYLNPEERKVAAQLHQTLRLEAQAIEDKIKILTSAGFNVQYLEQKWGRLLVAAYLGSTRLIDNIVAR